VRLLGEVAAEGRWILTEPPLDEARLSSRVAHSIGSETGTSFVAEADGAIVGDLGMHSATPESIWLGMGVARDWRGRGVGSALVAAAVDWARSHGFRELQLEVFPHNQAAIALYHKFGFVETERLRRRYRRRNGELWDAIVMSLPLDSSHG
jgi:RimJ/RimL family protein N-acetyltransferase